MHIRYVFQYAIILLFTLFNSIEVLADEPSLIYKVRTLQQTSKIPYIRLYQVTYNDSIYYYPEKYYNKQQQYRIAELWNDEGKVVHQITSHQLSNHSNTLPFVLNKLIWQNYDIVTPFQLDKLINDGISLKIDQSIKGPQLLNLQSGDTVFWSWKTGVHIYNNRKVNKYHFYPIKRLIFDSEQEILFPAEEQCNAILFQIGQEYWMFYQESTYHFEWIRTNSQGKLLQPYQAVFLDKIF